MYLTSHKHTTMVKNMWVILISHVVRLIKHDYIFTLVMLVSTNYPASEAKEFLACLANIFLLIQESYNLFYLGILEL